MSLQLFKCPCNGIARTGHYALHLLDVALKEYGKADSVRIVSAFDGFDSEQRVNDGLHHFLFNSQDLGDFRFRKLKRSTGSYQKERLCRIFLRANVCRIECVLFANVIKIEQIQLSGIHAASPDAELMNSSRPKSIQQSNSQVQCL
ncbi:MAG: hypothetical protein ACYDHF_07775 [Candidatus Cryosericum sp.]